jgi:16S rRNA (cytosine1407-C5)-methyltransferase
MTNPAFESYYRALYGARWESLRASLLEPPAAAPYTMGLKKPYFLDRASVWAAASLPLPEDGLIFDACAAPGGKTLVMASRMAPGASLIANELSRERRRRLSQVLDQHLPGEKRRQVEVRGFDAAALGKRGRPGGSFASVLLDAPCSSERHVLNDPAALAAWKPARPRFLAQRQWALLSSAFLLLQEGGFLAYITCALSLEENDGVSRRLIKKYGASVQIEVPEEGMGEAAEFGRIVLPDQAEGAGPIYLALFKKTKPMCA